MSCVPTEGEYGGATPEGSARWKNPSRVGFPPCVDGKMTYKPPLWFDVPEKDRDYSVKVRACVAAIETDSSRQLTLHLWRD